MAISPETPLYDALMKYVVRASSKPTLEECSAEADKILALARVASPIVVRKWENRVGGLGILLSIPGYKWVVGNEPETELLALTVTPIFAAEGEPSFEFMVGAEILSDHKNIAASLRWFCRSYKLLEVGE